MLFGPGSKFSVSFTFSEEVQQFVAAITWCSNEHLWEVFFRGGGMENIWRVIDDFFEHIWCVIDDLFWYFCCWTYMMCAWWIFLLQRVNWKYLMWDWWFFENMYFFLNIMMSYSLAEGELKIYDVGLMVRRLQRKKRNISQTPDKEIRKIWLEN